MTMLKGILIFLFNVSALGSDGVDLVQTQIAPDTTAELVHEVFGAAKQQIMQGSVPAVVARKAAHALLTQSESSTQRTIRQVEQEEEVSTVKEVISKLMTQNKTQKQSCTVNNDCANGDVCAGQGAGNGESAASGRYKWTCKAPSGNDCDNGYDFVFKGGCKNWNGDDGIYPSADDKYQGDSLTWYPAQRNDIKMDVAGCHQLCRAMPGCTAFVLGNVVLTPDLPYDPSHSQGDCQIYKRGCVNDNDIINLAVWETYECRASPTPAPTAEPCDASYCNNRGTIGGNKLVGCTCSNCRDNYEGDTCNTKMPCAADHCNNRGTIGGNQVNGCSCSDCTGNYNGPTCNVPKACDAATGNQASVTGNKVEGCHYTCNQYFKNPPLCEKDCACTDGPTACTTNNNKNVMWCYIGNNPNCDDATTHVAGSSSKIPWSELACQMG